MNISVIVCEIQLIYNNGQSSRDGVRKTYEEMISISLFITLSLMASFCAATLYRGNLNRKMNIVAIGIYSLSRHWNDAT